ncbi:MAG: hypothetical protein H6995_14565 [Pseudomonadales bacterium]|nr:hypothetical protein [Pseudomonadales bacterium]MCP5216221.1 hypothetical protein [Pseudomonadales bacterium]
MSTNTAERKPEEMDLLLTRLFMSLPEERRKALYPWLIAKSSNAHLVVMERGKPRLKQKSG